MNCKNCNYTLWQIKPGPCPECGSAFKPSDYEFVINSVRYCCPHCSQTYYGTGPGGHLVPREFACVSCGQLVNMDEMVLLPTQGVREEQTQVESNPWLERGKRHGFWKGFWGTVGKSLVGPGRLMEMTPVESSVGSAVWFSVVTALFVSLFTVIPMLVLMLVITFSIGAGGGGGVRGPGMGLAVILPALFMGGMILVGWVIMPALCALSAHLILKLTGGCEFGMRRSLQAMYYSTGANILSGVPCVGGYFGWIWWLVSWCIALKSAQRVSAVRATIAALSLPGIVFVGAFSLFGLVYYNAVTSLNAARTSTTWTPPGGAVSTASMPTLDTAATRVGSAFSSRQNATSPGVQLRRFPNHAAEALMNYSIMPGDVLLPGSMTDGQSAELLGHSLDEWSLRVSNHPQYKRELRDCVSKGEIGPAHRLGDWVFTYEGQNWKSPNSSLWIAVSWPDPELNEDPEEVAIVFADGSHEIVKVEDFQERLDAQNERRARPESGSLPQLAHPRDVLHLAGPEKPKDASDTDAPAGDMEEPAEPAKAEPSTPGNPAAP